MTTRREFLSVTGALLTVPFAASAQDRKPGKIFLIGCIPGGPLAPREHQWVAFRQGLRELGYVEGQNLVLEFRIPKEGIPADALVADLVRLNVDVLVMSTGLQIQVAKRATKTIPIVMTGSMDPVAGGLVSNLARPEGNVTGLSILPVELGGKRLELLRELLPKSRRIAMLWNPNEPNGALQLKVVVDAGRSVGVEIVPLEARAANDLGPAFKAASTRRADGLIVAIAGLFYGLRAQIMDLVHKARLPAIWGWESFGGFGALLVYGPSDTENYRRAAAYVDRILKGARPGDLPIEQSTTVKLVINLRTAKSLDIAIPQSLLLRADSVIE